MKRVYLVAPASLMLCFAGFTFWWSEARAARDAADTEAARQSKDAELAALYSGKEYVGRDGKKEAQADIARGEPKLFLYGRKTGAPDLDERATILKERFGVRLDAVAGCIVSEPLVTFVDAYDAEIRRFLTEKFGAGAFEQAVADARARWKAKENEKG